MSFLRNVRKICLLLSALAFIVVCKSIVRIFTFKFCVNYTSLFHTQTSSGVACIQKEFTKYLPKLNWQLFLNEK